MAFQAKAAAKDHMGFKDYGATLTFIPGSRLMVWGYAGSAVNANFAVAFVISLAMVYGYGMGTALVRTAGKSLRFF